MRLSCIKLQENGKEVLYISFLISQLFQWFIIITRFHYTSLLLLHYYVSLFFCLPHFTPHFFKKPGFYLPPFKKKFLKLPHFIHIRFNIIVWDPLPRYYHKKFHPYVTCIICHPVSHPFAFPIFISIPGT